MKDIVIKRRKQPDKLGDCSFVQQTLLDFTIHVSNNSNSKELLQKFEFFLKNHLGIENFILYTYEKAWKPILVSGTKATEYGDVSVIYQFADKYDTNSYYTYTNIKTHNIDIIIPLYKEKKIEAFLLMSHSEKKKLEIEFILKHVSFIQLLANIIFISIEKERRNKRNCEKATAFKELELASQIHNILMPDLSVTNKFEDINIESFYMSHFLVGGDYLDAFSINNNEEIVFCVADVAGKGISAALLLASFQATMKSIFTSNSDLDHAVKELNDKIFRTTNGERFITMFIGKYNRRTKELKYINVAHNPPILYNKNKDTTIYLTEGCFALGIMEHIDTLKAKTIKITDNSKLLCYTDGLTEFVQGQSICMNDKEVERYFCTEETSKTSIKTIRENLDINNDNNQIFDDVAMLGIDFNIERN